MPAPAPSESSYQGPPKSPAVPRISPAMQEGGAPPPSLMALFLGFLALGMMGFGGVLPMARRMIVEDRRWLTPEEFTDLLGLCQFLPGGNIINLSVAIGLRFHRIPGAFFSLFGLILVPSAVVVLLGLIYSRFANDAVVQHLFYGLAAGASGLLIAMGGKIIRPLLNQPVPLIMALVCFAAIAVLRLPLLPCMLVMAPAFILLRWKLAR